MKKPEVVDLSKSTTDIIAILSIELPFWIPIESGDYTLVNKRILKLHNDFWLVSVGNIIDGPFDAPYEFIVNEVQVTDQEYLERITGKAAKYYHKKKTKTTFTRAFTITPKNGALSAQEGTENWWQQLNRVVFSLISFDKYDELLSDINSFLDNYSTIIITSNHYREVRRVSFYETMLRILVWADTGEFRFLYHTQLAPDIRMADVPFPHFRVRRIGESRIFEETIQAIEIPSFHQLQWAKALNHNREKRYQETLLSASITLETLTYLYLAAQGFKSKSERNAEIKNKGGLAGWIRALKPSNMAEECKEVASLWSLRNDVVHKQKKLLEKEIEVIKKGIQSLSKLRGFLLERIDPDLLKLEGRFSAFLEPIPIGTTTSESIDGKAPIRIEWRREKDHYQTIYSTKADSNENGNPTSK